jgi:hypothetical protein
MTLRLESGLSASNAASLASLDLVNKGEGLANHWTVGRRNGDDRNA